ncbi:MAG: DUF3892 domain-containing protein [Bacilli bacterium]
MVYIDKVHYTRNSSGYEVIDKIKWTNNLYENATNECTKEQMIDFINEDQSHKVKTKYYRNYWWIIGEDVRVVNDSYLRTDSNNISSDNLSDLPRY